MQVDRILRKGIFDAIKTKRRFTGDQDPLIREMVQFRKGLLSLYSGIFGPFLLHPPHNSELFWQDEVYAKCGKKTIEALNHEKSEDCADCCTFIFIDFCNLCLQLLTSLHVNNVVTVVNGSETPIRSLSYPFLWIHYLIVISMNISLSSAPDRLCVPPKINVYILMTFLFFQFLFLHKTNKNQPTITYLCLSLSAKGKQLYSTSSRLHPVEERTVAARFTTPKNEILPLCSALIHNSFSSLSLSYQY